jgi:uncharacterized phage protein gp47/JayE
MTIPYAPPSVGPSGLVVSNYQSILADNLQAYLNIFGQTQYVGTDSAIYQLLSIFSLKIADCNLGLQLQYNQSSPATAVGAGLDRVLKMNGLVRSPFTYSVASLTVTGTNGTTIVNGFAQDVSGNLWALPSPTVIIGTSVTVTATCTTPGNIVALPGQVSLIATPVSGWTGVTNPAAAKAGVAVETDSKARARQAISVALPSLTTLQSTIADVLATAGVTRICPGYPTPGGPGTSIENPTGSTDSPWGNPAHSISMVVEGGTDADVAMSIYGARGIGCFTNGTTTVAVTDPKTGYVMNISFFRPTYTPVMVQVQVHGYATTPTSATLAAIQTVVANYLNTLNIGETVSVGALTYEVMALNNNLSAPAFGVRALQLCAVSQSPNGTITSGTNSLVVSSATGLSNGQNVTGPGVPYGTTISSIAGTTVTLSATVTVSSTAVPFYFGTFASTDLAMTNYNYAAQGILNAVAAGTV